MEFMGGVNDKYKVAFILMDPILTIFETKLIFTGRFLFSIPFFFSAAAAESSDMIPVQVLGCYLNFTIYI